MNTTSYSRAEFITWGPLWRMSFEVYWLSFLRKKFQKEGRMSFSKFIFSFFFSAAAGQAGVRYQLSLERERSSRLTKTDWQKLKLTFHASAESLKGPKKTFQCWRKLEEKMSLIFRATPFWKPFSSPGIWNWRIKNPFGRTKHLERAGI